MSKKILVSSCLIGKKCSYDGEARTDSNVQSICKRHACVNVCPEVEAGLGCPRERHEISGGHGGDVLLGTAHVISQSGRDRTGTFLKGAELALKRAARNGVSIAILKSRSPSCGKHEIHAGKFDGTLCDGPGVTAALLKRNGIKIFTEKEIEAIEEELR